MSAQTTCGRRLWLCRSLGKACFTHGLLQVIEQRLARTTPAQFLTNRFFHSLWVRRFQRVAPDFELAHPLPQSCLQITFEKVLSNLDSSW